MAKRKPKTDPHQQLLIETNQLLDLTDSQLSNGHRKIALDHLQKVRDAGQVSDEVAAGCKKLFDRLHSIDKAQVARFLALLKKDSSTTRIRAFAHKLNPDKAKIQARRGILNLDDLRQPLQWQIEGRGLYCVINDGGDTADSITSCCANFFELDGLTKEVQQREIGKIPELKDLIGLTVATREGDDGSLHCYFLLEEAVTDVWRWRLLQWRLIQLFSSDQKVEDPSRVMRLPGAWYVLGDNSFHSRSHIVEASTTGKRLSFEALEQAVAEAEEVRGLSAVDAVPESRWRDKAVQEMMTRLFPEETAKRTAEKKTSFADKAKDHFQSKPWHTARTLDEIKEALAMMPKRRPGLNTYDEDRKVLCGMATALEEVGLERGNALVLLEEADWQGWDAAQVLDSSMEMSSDTFWAHARKCGWKPKQEKVRAEEQQKKEAAKKGLIDDLKVLHEERVAGPELLDALMTLSVNTGLPITQLQKVFSELDQNEVGVERMSEALDLITAAQDEPISVEELVPHEFNSQVIEDFRKGVEASPLLILMLVLTVMSSVLPVGTKVRLLDYTNHDQAVLLYFLILTMSGGKKTLLFDELIENPIMASDIKSRAEQKFWQVRRLQAQAKAKKAQKQKGVQSKPADQKEVAAPEEGNGGAEDSSQSVPVQPLRHVVSDFTGEGLDRNCQQAEAHYSHGFLIGTDEGRMLLAGDQYKGGNSSYTTDKLTRLYDGKGGNQVRGDSRNERHYTSSHVAIAALLQPEIYDQIAAEAADDESGFWPRFLTVESAPVKMRRGTLEERQAAKQKTYPEVLAKLYDYCNQLGSHIHRSQLGQQPHFRFSDEAQEWWVKRAWAIEDQQEHLATNGDPMVARVMGKAAGQVGRLAALLHILDRAFKGGIQAQGTPSVEIPLATVEKAYLLQGRLISRTIRQRIRATSTGTKDDTQLLKDIQRRCLEKDPKGEGLKIGAIERFWNQKNRPSKEDLYQAITALASAGFGELQLSESNRGGFVYTALKPLAA